MTNRSQAAFARFPSALLALPVLGLLLAATTAPAQPPIGEPWPQTGNTTPWTGRLQGGGRVRVDPRTNRAVVEGPRGYETQLWDGVHRLRDGTELTVRNGRVVPNREMMDRRGITPEPIPGGGGVAAGAAAGSAPPPAPATSDPCALLVRQACGPDGACADTTKCSAARQLVDMAAEERARGGGLQGLTGTELKCRDALTDSFFAPCAPDAGAARR
jgi:hypothetical protein